MKSWKQVIWWWILIFLKHPVYYVFKCVRTFWLSQILIYLVLSRTLYQSKIFWVSFKGMPIVLEQRHFVNFQLTSPASILTEECLPQHHSTYSTISPPSDLTKWSIVWHMQTTSGRHCCKVVSGQVPSDARTRPFHTKWMFLLWAICCCGCCCYNGHCCCCCCCYWDHWHRIDV